MLYIKFEERVRKSDPRLFDNMMANVDLFLRKAMVLYHEAVRKHAHRDIWDTGYQMLSDQIMQFHKELIISVNKLEAFLTYYDFEFDRDFYMQEIHFRELYKDFCKSNNQQMEVWSKAVYSIPFQDHGICCSPRYFNKETNEEVQGKFLIGIRPRQG